MYKAGKRTKENMDTCHDDLKLVVSEAFKVSQVDFTVIEGSRSTERQQMLFDTGKSQVNPSAYTPQVLIKKGKHIVNKYRAKSHAFDFIVHVPGKPKLAYDGLHLMYLVGVFTSVGKRLYNEGRITHKIRSGTNWDMDGELKYDQNFYDAPHIELN